MLYRARIGLFSHLRGTRQISHCDSYTPYTGSSDVPLRLSICAVLFSIHIILSFSLVRYVEISADIRSPDFNLIGKHDVCLHLCDSSDVTDSSPQTSVIHYTHLRTPVLPVKRLIPSMLLLSGDIEVNPGPIEGLDEMRREIVKQIKASEDRLSRDIRSIKDDSRHSRVKRRHRDYQKGTRCGKTRYRGFR